MSEETNDVDVLKNAFLSAVSLLVSGAIKMCELKGVEKTEEVVIESLEWYARILRRDLNVAKLKDGVFNERF